MSQPRETQSSRGPIPALSFPEERVSRIKDLIQQTTAQIIPRNVSSVPEKEGRKVVVLVTGTTGILGSHLLRCLVNDSRVDQVYTLDRPSSTTSLHDRQARSFQKHSLDVSALSSVKLSSLEGTLLEHHFGLNPETYEKVSAELRSYYTCSVRDNTAAFRFGDHCHPQCLDAQL